MRTPTWGLPIFLALGLSSVWHSVNGAAVMSIDLGTEWMKVAIVVPGIPMEIALNKESKRKTPAYISFRNSERTFGEDAVNVAVRFPSLGYGYLLDLLGKKVDNPIVQLFQKRFPHYKIKPHPERQTVVFEHDSETDFTVEELVGMILHKGKEFAEQSAGMPVTDAVFVVPGYYNQAERLAFISAARLANIKVLQLINDYTAVALNYGIFRRKDFNETAQYIMFYDMGASSTSATLVSYQLEKSKDREINPQLTILGVGYDRTLGGLEVQLRLQKLLAEKFNQVKKTKANVFDNPRAMAKLFKEAGRVKNVLSANMDHYAQIEGLLDEEDFKVQVTREQLEGLCEDLFARVRGPIDQALKMSGLPMDIVSQVTLVGAGTRMPKVQEMLSNAVNMELGKNINTDEAAVMGAVYKAADISAGFKVKKFVTKDGVLLPVQISYQRATDSDDTKNIKRTLFGVMNMFPQKKVLKFNKHTSDFDFTLQYADLDHLPKNEVEAIGGKDISKFTLKGVSEAIARFEGPNIDPKGVHAHFRMDESGVLSLVNVDYVVEKKVTGDDDEQSTFQKIGSSFTKFFGASEPAPVEETSDEATPPNASAEPNDKKPAPEEEKKEAKQETNKTDTKQDDKAPPQDGPAKNGTAEKIKTVLVREPITPQTENLGVTLLNEDLFAVLEAKIKAMNDVDERKRRKEQARNALESFVFDAQNKLNIDEYQAAATEEEKQSISKACAEMSEWLDDDGSDEETSVYEEKLVQVKSLTGPLYRRVKEHEERPEALAAITNLLNTTNYFYTNIVKRHDEAKAKEEDTVFTQVEIDTLEKLIRETEEWKRTMEAEQAKLPLSANPKLTVLAIVDKITALDRELKYLLNKDRIWKPKKKESTNSTTTANKTEKAKESEGEGKEEVKIETEENEEAKIPDIEIEEKDEAETQEREEEVQEEIDTNQDQDTHQEL